MAGNPTHSDLHVSAALTDISVLLDNQDAMHVFDRVFPRVPVSKRGDKYYVWDRQDFQRSDAQDRAPGAAAVRSGPRLNTEAYYCERKALGHAIADPDRANADPAVADLDTDAVRYLTGQIRLAWEKKWVSDFFTTGVWNGASSSTDMTGQANPTSTTSNFRQWNDVASNPIEDIRGEIRSIAKTGTKPNTLVLGSGVATVLADHPDIVDRIKYTERGIVTMDLLASLLGLDNVFESWVAEDTAKEQAAASYAFVAGQSALLCYSAPNPGLRTPTAGYTFVWTGMPGTPAGGGGVRVKRYRDEPHESDIIEAESWLDNKVISAALGAFFASAVSGS